jgi:hypothetical protein
VREEQGAPELGKQRRRGVAGAAAAAAGVKYFFFLLRGAGFKCCVRSLVSFPREKMGQLSAGLQLGPSKNLYT